MKTLYKSRWILPGGGIVIKNGGFSVENGIICDVFTANELNNVDLRSYEVIDFYDAVITPGFINLHTHLQYTEIGKKRSKSLINRLKRLALILRKQWIFKGNNKGFTSWIVDLIIEYLCLTNEEKIESFGSGLQQAIRSGTTTIVQLSGEEMYFDILNANPVNAYVFFEVFADSEERAENSFKNFAEKYERLLPKCSKNTFVGISPHSIYNVHKYLWERISEFSRQNNVLIHTHFAESSEEMDWLATGRSGIDKLHKFAGCKYVEPHQKGLLPIDYLKKLGLPYENVILAHINQLPEENYRELADLGANIAHCPRSNIKLHGKTLNLSEAIKHLQGRIGLGTDSLYSNDDLNIRNEARFALESGVDLLTVLDMLTIIPAKILQIDHLTGSIEKDKQADFLVFKTIENNGYDSFIDNHEPDSVFIAGKPVV